MKCVRVRSGSARAGDYLIEPQEETDKEIPYEG
jgi:hypothetical protein